MNDPATCGGEGTRIKILTARLMERVAGVTAPMLTILVFCRAPF